MVDSQLYQREKNFSQLGEIQKQSSIRYQVKCTENHVQYTVTHIQNGQAVSEQMDVVGLSAITAQMILEFLYENAVSVQQWKDVLLDIIAKV